MCTGSDLFVRGCLNYLLNDDDVTYSENTCTRGEYHRFEPWSFTIKKSETFDYCNEDLCNTKTAFTKDCVDMDIVSCVIVNCIQ